MRMKELELPLAATGTRVLEQILYDCSSINLPFTANSNKLTILAIYSSSLVGYGNELVLLMRQK